MDKEFEFLRVKAFPADVSSLDAVQDFAGNLMKEAGIAQEVAGRVALTVEEVFVNIALYAYKKSGTGGEVMVRCGVGPEIVSLEFTDEGSPFNPLEHEDPDVALGAGEREPGGLGLFIVKKIMDAVEYRREGGKNVLRMSKHVK
jgi:sigma-B regulation protein RsbU (phosphoserine phosphatase)